MANIKLIATVASIWIQCSGGASYAFGIYSAVLKSSQGYDQSTLDTVSFFKDIGANIGVLAGLLYHAVTNNRSDSSPSSSPWRISRLLFVYLTGEVQCFLGYILIWFSVKGFIEPPVWLMCFFMFIASHAQTFFNTANIVVAVKNFPDYGGTTVGIMKGFLGLSGAILIQFYTTLSDDPANFILMLAFLPTLVSSICMFLVHESPSNTTHDKHHLNKFSLIALTIAVYLTTILISQSHVDFPPLVHFLTTIILLLLILSPILIIPSNEQVSVPAPTASASTITNPLLEASKDQENTQEGEEDDHEIKQVGEDKGQETPPVNEDMNIIQAMKTFNFWLLFVSMVCAMGTGLATINNLTQIGESLDYTANQINMILSLWSIWNFFGRFGGGFVSDLFLHKYGWGRPLFICVTLAAMVAGHFIIVSGWDLSLYIGTAIVGICYGSQWSLMPTISSEIFGVTHMGTIFNTIAAANPIGSGFFSVMVIGSIYDKEAGMGGGGLCMGIHCFMVSFYVFAGVCGFGLIVSLVLYVRTKEFYAKIFGKRGEVDQT